MAKKKDIIEEPIIENISIEPLEEVMGDRYATYAKYVIQDRAIPDVRDGLKPVQRRIIFSMYNNGNTFNKPTKKCAHTVGEVMGKFHPHGDTSIYDALSRMSQDWKVRYPLIDFQGNKGSIDGDSPAAYRYTESRLAKLSNELIKDIDKQTVDMQLNFDDTEFEPIVLPARFPNLLVNGSEGIAVALATEIPPHNLNEVIDAVIYRINHKNASVEDLMEIVKGPDFPTGGVIYNSDGLKSIYLTGKGRIEVASKAEIVQQKDIQQIIITQIPYKTIKKNIAYEIDMIRHNKSIDGILEVRDESGFQGIKIAVDIKKDARADLILQYLMNKTSLAGFYSANMVAIVNGRPKTLNLLDFVDAYIAHQIDVVTRKTKFDLNRFTQRVHIIQGLILASININEIVEIIKKSKDKNDSKLNLINKYNFSNEQAEAIVMMPLYKLSHTDEEILEKEKVDLDKAIIECKEILENPNKLNKVICSDLKAIKSEYGDERRTLIIEKEEVKPIDKRDLIAKEEVMVSLTRDGYAKRSSLKSYKSSNDILPGLKSGDVLVGSGVCLTTDYLFAFTNLGNYICLPVHLLNENRWKEEGAHINSFATLYPGEKIIKGIVVSDFRDDIYLVLATKYGQIKRTCLNQLDNLKHARPMRIMKLINSDEVVNVELLSGDSDIMIFTDEGNISYFNENDLSIVSSKAGGVKAMANLANQSVKTILTFDKTDHDKIILITDNGSLRIFDNTKANKTNRLGKQFSIFKSFKNDKHFLITALKVDYSLDYMDLVLGLNNGDTYNLIVDDFHLTDINKMAKKNINIPAKTQIISVYGTTFDYVNQNTISHPIVNKENFINFKKDASSFDEAELKKEQNKEDKKDSFEQISIFDDLD